MHQSQHSSISLLGASRTDVIRLMDKPRTSDASATINEMYARDFTSETDKFDEAICNGFLEHGRKYQLRR